MVYSCFVKYRRMVIAFALVICTILTGKMIWQNITVAQYASPSHYTLSLQAGSTKAALSGNIKGKNYAGEAVKLSAEPFFECGIFYFPLQDVIEVIGGTCEITGEKAIVRYLGKNMEFYADKMIHVVNGITYRCDYSEMMPPRMVDDIFYFPYGFQGNDPLACETGFNGGWNYFDRGLLILSRGFNSDPELEVGGVHLLDQFRKIPESVRKNLVSTGIELDTSNPMRYDYERYEGDGIVLWVARVRDGMEDGYGIDNTVCSIHLTDNTYHTFRGLKVGDSKERAEFLYGDLERLRAVYTGWYVEFKFDENDIVKEIVIGSRHKH